MTQLTLNYEAPRARNSDPETSRLACADTAMWIEGEAAEPQSGTRPYSPRGQSGEVTKHGRHCGSARAAVSAGEPCTVNRLDTSRMVTNSRRLSDASDFTKNV